VAERPQIETLPPGFAPVTTPVAEREQKISVVLGHDILWVCGIFSISLG